MELIHRVFFPGIEKRPLLTPQVEELETLLKLLHFPEEVALRLADTEYHLFYQVQPIDYLRHVTLDLGVGGGPGGGAGGGPGGGAGGTVGGGAGAVPHDDNKPSVRTLINRFIQVSHFLLSHVLLVLGTLLPLTSVT